MKDPYVLEDGTLKNLLGINDYHELNRAERDIGFIKLTNINQHISHNFDTQMFQNIHKHIFEDIFSWAGEFRTVPIYKQEIVIPGLSLEYCDYTKIPQELDKVFEEFNKVDWQNLNLDDKSEKFTKLLAKLWRIHPFRDGNTRTTMAFASIFSKEHNFPMDLGFILDNLTRKMDENGKITNFSIRDKFVLAALDEKDYPEPQHLQIVLKKAIYIGITKNIEQLSKQINPSNSDEQER